MFAALVTAVVILFSYTDSEAAAVEKTVGVEPVTVSTVKKAAGATKGEKTEESPFKTPAELIEEAASQDKGAVLSPEPEIQSEQGTVAIPATAPALLPATAAAPIPAPAPPPKRTQTPQKPKPVVKKSGPAKVEPAQPEKEPTVEGEAAPKEDAGLDKLPPAVPGKFEYLNMEMPAFPVLDLAVIPLDSHDSPGIVMLTSSSMEIYKFESATRLKRVWRGAFKDDYPLRGLSGSLNVGLYNGRPLIFVSMTPFKKSFAYEWKDGQLLRAGKVSSLVVGVNDEKSVTLVSEYGRGVVTFAGRESRLVDTAGKEPRSVDYPLPVDFYSGCVLRWSDVSANLTQVALATEDGRIQVYQGSQSLKAETEAVYGDTVLCGAKSPAGDRLIATTSSSDDDAVVALEFTGSGIEERWRSPGLGGAVVGLTGCDLDADGVTETLGILRKKSGGKVLFRLLPVYESEPAAPDKEKKDRTKNDADKTSAPEKSKPAQKKDSSTEKNGKPSGTRKSRASD